MRNIRFLAKALMVTGALLTLVTTGWSSPRPGIHQATRGRLSGVVENDRGTPQMGATVWIVGQNAASSGPIKLFTNDKGVFSVDDLLPGLYSIRVSLASYLPVIKKNISIEAGARALLTVQLSTLFDSLEALGGQRPADLEEDEWKWVLRTSAATRPVLRLVNGQVDPVAGGPSSQAPQPRMVVEVTSGAGRRSGLGSDLSLVSSLFAYDQPLPDNSHLLLTGGFGYNRTAGGVLGATWAPGPWTVMAPQISMSVRQYYVPRPDGTDTDARSAYRGMRVGFANTYSITPRLWLDYGMDYIAVNLAGSAQALRPRGELVFQPSDAARFEFTVANGPSRSVDSLASAVEALDSFPSVTLTAFRPHLESVFHQGVTFEYKFSNGAQLHAAAFRDSVRNAAVLGEARNRESLDPGDYLLDPVASGFTVSGGEYAVVGTRVVYRQTFFGRLETTVGYANLGGLVPASSSIDSTTSLRDILRAQRCHALTARVSTRLPRLGTRVAAGYRWLSKPMVGPLDPYDDSSGQLEPNLSLQLRQPLPQFFLLPGRMEVLADIRNLLAQGYVPITSADGQVLYLVPTFRSFRGGVSFQF